MIKKLIVTISLLSTLSLAIDFITPIFIQLGADNSQVGHFIVGNKIADICEDNLKMEPFSSFLVVYLMAEFKEKIDVISGSYRNQKDVEWTCYGWLMKRCLTFEFDVDAFIKSFNKEEKEVN